MQDFEQLPFADRCLKTKALECAHDAFARVTWLTSSLHAVALGSSGGEAHKARGFGLYF